MQNTDKIPACLIVDDFPINGSYWTREQQTAFGFTPTSGGLFGYNWRAQQPAAFCPIQVLEEFADIADEFELGGKFTVLPCPAGLGRIDGTVRGVEPGYIERALDIVRRRIVPRFNITPEVLTHSMAYDVNSGALLPHTESAWVSYLAGAGRHEELYAYLGTAWSILRNVGIMATGLTIGGIPDLSGITNERSLVEGHHREALSGVLCDVMRSYVPAQRETFLFAYGRPVHEPYVTSRLPEPIFKSDDGVTVLELLCDIPDILLNLMHAEGDPIAEADKLIARDLSSGALVDCIDSGMPVVLLVHAQTLNSLNSGLGVRCLRETVRRLRERYGRTLQWMPALELCRLSMIRHSQ